MRPTTLRVFATRDSVNAFAIVTVTPRIANEAGLRVESIACCADATVLPAGARNSFATSCVIVKTATSERTS